MADETVLSPNAPQPETGVAENPTVAPAEKTESQAPAAAPSFAGIVAENGALAENWRELLPEEIRNEPSLQNIKHFGALAKSYVHAQKAIGANKVAIPGKDATEEEKSSFFSAIGRPETADNYEFARAAELPQEIGFDEELMKGFREEAFRIGLTQEQFNAAVNYEAKVVAARLAQQREAADREYAETYSKLKAQYGARCDEVIAQCNKAVQTFGLAEVLTEHGLLNNYDFIQALAGIGERISESKLKGDPGSAVAPDAASRLAEITGNLDDPYYKREHPLHERRVEEVNRLIAQQRARTV